MLLPALQREIPVTRENDPLSNNYSYSRLHYIILTSFLLLLELVLLLVVLFVII